MLILFLKNFQQRTRLWMIHQLTSKDIITSRLDHQIALKPQRQVKKKKRNQQVKFYLG